MRTTIDLADDVLLPVKRMAASEGRTFQDVVNDLLRFALLKPRVKGKGKPFRLPVVHGTLPEGLTYERATSRAHIYGDMDPTARGMLPK